jgi:adenine phosphoribosyltransferase
VTPAEQTSAARSALLRTFRWDRHGHADVWLAFRDGDALATIVRGLVAPWRTSDLTAVVGIESRGFLLGGAAAVELGLGFVAVRKAGSLFAGDHLREDAARDYRGNRHELLMQQGAIAAGERLLLVDDWIETGSQASAVARLVRASSADLVGITVMVDQLPDETAKSLPPVHALVQFDDLPAAPQ